MLYFFYGDEEYFISKEIETLKNNLDPNFLEMSYKVVDNPSLPDLIAVLRTPAMMFGKMLIVVKCEKYFSVKASADITDDKLLKMLKESIEDATNNSNIDIIFKAYVDSEKKERAGIDKRKKIFKILSNCGNSKEFVKIPTYKVKDIESWVSLQAKEKGIKLNQDVVSQLVLQVGNDLRLIDSELDKLTLYAGKDAITVKMVKEICVSNEDIFEFLQCLIDGNKCRAVEEYNKLIFKKFPLEILAVLQTMLYRKIQLKAKSKKMSNDDLAKDLKMHPFRVKLELEDLKNVPLKHLIKIKENFTHAEFKIKSGKALDLEREIEYAILR